MKTKVYGYCRVSTMRQSLERQKRNIIEKYPDAIIVTDEYTGTKLNRPGWTKLYKQLKTGDTIVFDQVSRMSRDAEEGFQVYENLYNLGVNLIFLKEPHINTSVFKESVKRQLDLQIRSGKESFDKFGNTIIKAFNELLLDLAKEQIRLAFEQAEKEVDDLHQKTKEGIREKKRRNEELILEYGSEEAAKKSLEWTQIGQEKGAKLITKKSIEAKKIILKRSKDFNGSLSDIEMIKLTGIARGTYYKYKRELRENL